MNFTAVCIQSGRYVIFYNERLDGVRYPEGYEFVNAFTELCEVVVEGKFIKLFLHCTNFLIDEVTPKKSLKSNRELLYHVRYPFNMMGFSEIFFDEAVQNLRIC